MYKIIPRIFCHDAQVDGILAQIKNAQRMIVAVNGENFGSAHQKIVDKLIGASEFKPLVPNGVAAIETSHAAIWVVHKTHAKATGACHL